jgi:hypothetical protein
VGLLVERFDQFRQLRRVLVGQVMGLAIVLVQIVKLPGMLVDAGLPLG